MSGQITVDAPVQKVALPPGRVAVAVAVVAVLAILAAYIVTGRSIVEVWYRSETFSHGFVVVPIALWLILQRRAELSAATIAPNWFAAVALATVGFVWLLGDLSGTSVVKQFALVFMVQLAVIAVIGFDAARVILFPLAFLMFAVPFGEFLVPQLMEWTADFTIAAVRLSGVPVYREGNSFVIPSGHWSVVEACSGIRYLIASLMVGTLYAYVSYRSLRRRLIFVGVSIAVPLVANWLRAYIIVMLGHVSGNTLAAGVDHLVYGWLFFGLVLALMFMAGARFREDAGHASDSRASRGTGGGVAGPAALMLAGVVAIAVTAPWPLASRAMFAAGGGEARVVAPIDAANGWTPVTGEGAEFSPRFSGHRAARHSTFEKDGARVAVYVAYYAGQVQGHELINSENVVVATADPTWRETARGRRTLEWAGRSIEVRTAALASATKRLQTAWWYWLGGRTSISPSLSKARLAWARLTGQPDDSAAVFLIVEAGDHGDALLDKFASEMGEAIDRSLLATYRSRR